ncbi:MAG: SRPBCC family protein [Gammaproteobacteria bacterium]|nr:SRPBCC family protein [Gammaproteobacteria bacterium]
MAVHRLSTRQVVPASLDEAWAFFSSPRNLPLITPPWLDLRLTSEPPAQMYPGLIITYTVRPLLGVPLPWATEITHVEERVRFVDDQRVGPYSLWHHQHHFREVEGGTEVCDTVHYALPFGPLGDIVARLAVRPRLHAIFEYRRAVLRERFGVAG